jgi:hypothetical protein
MTPMMCGRSFGEPQARETFRNAILTVLADNQLDALVYPTIRQKPIKVPERSERRDESSTQTESGLGSSYRDGVARHHRPGAPSSRIT